MTTKIGIEYIDDLTWLFNRRYLFKQAPLVLNESHQQKIPLAIILLDLDHFKNINDSFGHACGDKVLQEFALFLKKVLREDDLIFRYGGDEFVCVLPNATYDQAVMISERFIERCRSQEFNRIRVTISVGIASSPENAQEWQALFEIADRNLYSAKRHGRDRVGFFQEESKKLLIPTEELVGRDEEIEKIEQSIEVIFHEKGGALSICGEAGVGKTRLVHEVVQQNSLEKIPLVQSNLSTITQSIPYYPFREIIRSLQKQYPLDVSSSISEAYLTELIKMVPELATESQATAGTIDMVDKYRLFEGVRQYFRMLVQKTPLLVFLDNIQWADMGSMELLHYLLKSFREQPIYFVFVYRIEEASEGSLPQILQLMAREGLYRELKLNPLSQAEVARLLSAMMDCRPPPELTNFIVQNTGGNPFFIEELLKSMESHGALKWNSSGWHYDPSKKVVIPYTVEGVVERRLSMISDDAKNLLEYAAVIGRKFDLLFLVHVTKLNEGQLFDLVDEILRVRLFKEHKGERYQFSEDVIREIIYRKINGVKLQHHHKLLGHSLMELNGHNPDELTEELAYHFYHAKECQQAVEFCTKAADKSRKAYANRNAIRFYDWALECLAEIKDDETSSAMIRCLLKKADVLNMIGNNEEAEKNIVQALELTRQIESVEFEAKCILKLSSIQQGSRKYEQALTLVEQALDLYNNLEDLPGKALCYHFLGNCHFYLADYPQTIEFYKQSLAIHQKTGDRNSEANLVLNLGVVYKEINEYEQALACYQQSLAMVQANNDLQGEAINYVNQSNIYLILGDNAKAKEFSELALTKNELVGDRRLVGTCHTNMGIALIRLGDDAGGLDNLNRAQQIYEEVGDEHGLALNFSNIGSVHYEHGELNKAFTFYQRALQLFSDLNEKAGQARVLQNLGRMFYVQGNYDEALQHLQQSTQLNEQINNLRELATCLIDLATIHSMSKDFAKADELCQKAYSIALETTLQPIQAYVLFYYSALSLEKGELQEATKHFQQLTSVVQELQSIEFDAHLNLIQARLYTEQKEWEQALHCFQQAFTTLHELCRPFEEAKLKYYQGEMFQQSGNAEQAQQCFMDAKIIFSELAAQDWLSRTEEKL